MSYPFAGLRTPDIATSFDGATPYADPFVDVASAAMPVSVPAMLRHAEWFAVRDETFREALNRVAAYFVTDVEIDGELGQDEKDAQKDFLEQEMGIVPRLVEATLSHLVYGNQYTSIIQPIVRYLVCPKCSTQYRAEEAVIRKKFIKWSGGKFKGKCKACNFDGVFGGGPEPGQPLDIPDESRPPIFKSWNPHDIRIVYNAHSGETEAYDWVIPADFRNEVKQGTNEYVLISTPWDELQAAASDMNVRYGRDYVHHWREPALAGLRFRGVGVPRAIINFRQLYHCQVLRRMNEVLALGHVVPVRVVSPMPGPGRGVEDGDVLKTGFMGDIKSQWQQIVANHRADPASMHFSPIPLQMQALGADARQLIPADILNQSLDVLLNGSGVPVDFYKMSMQTQAAPVGLRLIERYWSPLVAGLNTLLAFTNRRLQFLKKWEKSVYRLASVRLVDSIEMNQLRVQMAQAGLTSKTQALKTVELDFRDETRQKLEDARIEQVEQAEFQAKMDAYAFSRQLAEAVPTGGMAPPGGQPGQPAPGGGDPAQAQGGAPQGDPSQSPAADPLTGVAPTPGVPIDPQELESRAQAAAQMLLQLPESQRFSKLQEIKKNNDQFHKLVRGHMDEMRSKMRSQGQQIVAQQSGFAP